MNTSPIYEGQDDEDYKDLYVHITTDKGDQWRFFVSLDKPEDTIYDGDVTWAADEEDSFDGYEDDVPEEVVRAFHAIRPKMVSILEAVRSGV